MADVATYFQFLVICIIAAGSVTAAILALPPHVAFFAATVLMSGVVYLCINLLSVGWGIMAIFASGLLVLPFLSVMKGGNDRR